MVYLVVCMLGLQSDFQRANHKCLWVEWRKRGQIGRDTTWIRTWESVHDKAHVVFMPQLGVWPSDYCKSKNNMFALLPVVIKQKIGSAFVCGQKISPLGLSLQDFSSALIYHEGKKSQYNQTGFTLSKWISRLWSPHTQQAMCSTSQTLLYVV